MDRHCFSWALAFFILAATAAIFGIANVGHGATVTAKILFVVFTVLFLVAMVAGAARR